MGRPPVHLPELRPHERLYPAFNALDQFLAGLAAPEGEGISLEQANSLWTQQGFAFLSKHLDLLAQDYGAEVRPEGYAGGGSGLGLFAFRFVVATDVLSNTLEIEVRPMAVSG